MTVELGSGKGSHLEDYLAHELLEIPQTQQTMVG